MNKKTADKMSAVSLLLIILFAFSCDGGNDGLRIQTAEHVVLVVYIVTRHIAVGLYGKEVLVHTRNIGNVDINTLGSLFGNKLFEHRLKLFTVSPFAQQRVRH